MKTYKNLFEQIISKDNLRRAFFDAAKRKRNRNDIKRILENVDEHIDILQGILIREEFYPAYHEPAVINDGFRAKKRTIIKPYYKYEQVVHHAIIQVLAPTDKDIAKNPSLRKVLNRGCYEFTCGSIKGRGAHYGKKYLERWLRNDYGGTRYVMKIDIRHFYESIPHDRLKAKLRTVMADEKTLRLLDRIIDSVPNGLPLGYHTSNWLANFYLQDLDHYMKQEIFEKERKEAISNYISRMKRKGISHYTIPKYKSGLKYVIRYADDIVALVCNKRDMRKALDRVCDYCKDHLGLLIKDNMQVFPMSAERTMKYYSYVTGESRYQKREHGRAIDFMGFLFRGNRTTIRKSVLYRITRKVRKVSAKDKVNWYDACSVISRIGYFKHTDTYRVFRERVTAYVDLGKLKHIVSKHFKKKGAVANYGTV